MPSHARHRRGRRHRLWPWGLAALALGALGALGAGSTALLGRGKPPQAAASERPRTPPLRVVATSPANGSTVVTASAITVRLSSPLRPSSPLPQLSPPVAGSWERLSPTALQFDAAGPLVPGSAETLTVPGGRAGLTGSKGQHLRATVTSRFSVAPGSTLRLQQLLAELGYLPVSFAPATPATSPSEAAAVQPGTFAWRWPNLPASLTALWVPGTYGVLTRGAVMAFETQHGLGTDGVAGPQVWAALLAAASTGASDPQPYDYVTVSTALPQSVTVYRDGAEAYHTVANTGVAAMPTTSGTYPVYLRYQVTTMSGRNPTGSHYTDPGIPWVSYFHGGDALHGFVRAAYGFPQSDGCVEMPPANAAVVWPMTPIGTLVTVE